MIYCIYNIHGLSYQLYVSPDLLSKLFYLVSEIISETCSRLDLTGVADSGDMVGSGSVFFSSS